MEDLFSIAFPKTVSDHDLETLEAEIKQLDGVADTGLEDTLSVDPATLGIWVQVAKDVLGVVGIAVPIILQIIERIRDKGIKNVKITFANGTIVDADAISAKNLESVLKAAMQQ